jgi:hypothetical protein
LQKLTGSRKNQPKAGLLSPAKPTNMSATTHLSDVNPTEQSPELVALRVAIPREALDMLAFRYYRLGIAKNDAALAQAAISEMVHQHLALELLQLQNRRN